PQQLDPGPDPYPFWHDAKKWSDYQRANGITLWIDPYTSKIVVGQFSRQEGADPRLNTASRVPPAFDGKWMWVDDKGEPQPKPALFVGLFRSTTPTRVNRRRPTKNWPPACATVPATTATSPAIRAR